MSAFNGGLGVVERVEELSTNSLIGQTEAEANIFKEFQITVIHSPD